MKPDYLRERLVDVAALALQARDETNNDYKEVIRVVGEVRVLVERLYTALLEDFADDIANDIADQADEQSERVRGQLPYTTGLSLLPTDPELEAEHMRPEDFKS